MVQNIISGFQREQEPSWGIRMTTFVSFTKIEIFSRVAGVH